MDLILDSILEDAFDDIVDDAIEDGEVESTDDEEQMYEVPVDTPEEYSDPYIMYSDDEDEGENDYEDGSTYEVGATDEDNDLDAVIADLDARIAGEDTEEDEEDIFVQESASMKGDNFFTLEDGNVTLEAFDRFISESYILNNTIEISDSAIFTEGAKFNDAIKKVKDFFTWIWDKIVELYETIKRKIIDFVTGDLWLEKKAKEFKNAKVNISESAITLHELNAATIAAAAAYHDDADAQEGSNENSEDNSNQPRSRINLKETEIDILDVPVNARHSASVLLEKSLDCTPNDFMNAIKDIDRTNKEAIANECKKVLGMNNITFNHELPQAVVQTDKIIDKGKIKDASSAQIISATIESYVYNSWFQYDKQAITVAEGLRIKNKYCDQYLNLRKYITDTYNKKASHYNAKKTTYLNEISKLEKQMKDSYNKQDKSVDEEYYIALQKMREVCNIHTTAIKSNLNAIARCINIEYRSIRGVLLELMMCAGFINKTSMKLGSRGMQDPISTSVSY